LCFHIARLLVDISRLVRISVISAMTVAMAVTHDEWEGSKCYATERGASKALAKSVIRRAALSLVVVKVDGR
jgi:hypothetical protein